MTSPAGSGDASRPAARRPVLAASIAVFRDGRVLLAQRAKDPGAGVWSLPGGRVEAGETMEVAALRELQEEVGLAAEIVAFNRHVEVIRHDPEGALTAHFVVASFVGLWRSGVASACDETTAVAWVDPLSPQVWPLSSGLQDVLLRAAAIMAARSPS
jgi:ADP-ribose pyrophosphatase YjhB (NUDIX family)